MDSLGIPADLRDYLLDYRSGIGLDQVNESARKHVYHLSTFMVDPFRTDAKGLRKDVNWRLANAIGSRYFPRRLSALPEGCDLQTIAISRLARHPRSLPGVRPAVRAGAGLLSRRDVRQLC